jgi:beta-aspartyl-peptidase (threonine type)
VTTLKNPIIAARLVMDRSESVMLIGPEADDFAQRHGAEIVSPEYFHTEMRWRMLQEKLAGNENPPQHEASSRCGTVGCVALDRGGNLAAGTSTGGMTAKPPGRVGDSPIIGGGTIADNASCAVSATGDGEYFIRTVAAHDIAALVEYKGLSLAEAARIVIHEKVKPLGGEGGVIVLDRLGRMAMTFSSEGMYRGYITRGGQTFVSIYREK